jgi:hypothetical protein
MHKRGKSSIDKRVFSRLLLRSASAKVKNNLPMQLQTSNGFTAFLNGSNSAAVSANRPNSPNSTVLSDDLGDGAKNTSISLISDGTFLSVFTFPTVSKMALR